MRKITIHPERQQYAPGDTVSGYVEVLSDKVFTFNAMYVTLECEEHTRVTVGSGDTQTTYREKHVHYHEAHELMQAGEFTYGESRFEFSFTLPEGLPSTYSGANGSITLILEAKIEISWAVDPKDKRELTIFASRGQVQPEPVRQSDLDDGIAVLEVDIPNNVVCAGDYLQFRYRVDREVTMRGVRLELYRSEQATARGHKRTQRIRISSDFIDDSSIMRDSWNSATLLVPFSIPTTYRGPLIKLTTTLKVVIDIPWKRDRDLRIKILTFHCTQDTRKDLRKDPFSDYDFGASNR
jgi:hypothetical protein